MTVESGALRACETHPRRRRAEPIVERENLMRARVLGREEDAAVRQLEPCVGAEDGEAGGGVRRERDLSDLERTQRGMRRVEPPMAGGSHENLGDRYGTRCERVQGEIEESIECLVMQSVALVQMRDEHARVDDDHAGQSSRSWLRYSGP